MQSLLDGRRSKMPTFSISHGKIKNLFTDSHLRHVLVALTSMYSAAAVVETSTTVLEPTHLYLYRCTNDQIHNL